MSQPKRFDFWMYQKPCDEFGIRATMQIEFSENGRCVFWDDYAALAAENAVLKMASADVDASLNALPEATRKAVSARVAPAEDGSDSSLTAGIKALAAENERLKAEVEWLRKAERLVCWNPATQAWEVRHEVLK